MSQFKLISILLLSLFLTGCSTIAVSPGETDGNNNLKVVLQDQTTDSLGIYLMQLLNNVTLAVNTSIGDHDLNLVAGHNFVTGDWLCLQENNKLYQGEVLNVVGDVITVDSPLDYGFSVNAYGCRSNINMAVDGSVTPVIFRIRPMPEHWTVDWDITRIICSITDNSAMDSASFGGITALTNGVVLRKKNGEFKNLYNVKTNGQYADIAYDVAYDDRSTGAGQYGFRVRKTWAGQAKSGVAIRLQYSLDDELQNLIQDDLSSLSTYYCRAMGSLTN